MQIKEYTERPTRKYFLRKSLREDMIKRAPEEKKEKALKANYHIAFADNNFKTNKPGTIKPIMYAFQTLKSKPRISKKLSRQYPSI